MGAKKKYVQVKLSPAERKALRQKRLETKQYKAKKSRIIKDDMEQEIKLYGGDMVST